VKHHDVSLVLTGAVGAGAWGSAHSTRAEVSDLIARLGLDRLVRMPGYVTAEQLGVLYEEASMLAFPSRFEGFGIPVVEAMSAGCPVVVADATALPALVGDAGLLVSPDDVGAWADAMAGLLENPDARARLAEAGRARAAELAAVDPVTRVVDAYHRAAS